MASSTGSARAALAASAWGAVVYLTDCLPPRIRYGYVHRLTRALLRTPLPALAALPHDRGAVDALAGPTASEVDSTTTCVLAADALDIGGIGSVIEMLARGLGDCGVRPVVVTTAEGARADRLRRVGVDVTVVTDEESALTAITALSPDVIQSHSAPPFLESAARRSGVPLMPVMHNTEIHYTKARWADFAGLMAESVMGIAVSETVREFHLRHIGDATPIIVIPNGAPTATAPSRHERAAARSALSQVLGAELGDDIVFVTLARYDAQKNIAGLTAAFSDAVSEASPAIRLVCAGDPSDWTELRRADAIRRAGAARDRIHFLGNSDARTLLTAADAFVLDSFFEGWPVAATEAAAFGLPLLLADVGGAAELVARDPGRSLLIANATGAASEVSDRRVRAARRRSRRQPNAPELRDAVRRIADTVLAERRNAPASEVTGAAGRSAVDSMNAAHAEAIRAAAAGRTGHGVDAARGNDGSAPGR